MRHNETLDKVKYTVLNNLLNGNGVGVHISRLNTNEKYDAVLGIYLNDEESVSETFEFENVTNKELDKISEDLDKFVKDSRLFLTKG